MAHALEHLHRLREASALSLSAPTETLTEEPMPVMTVRDVVRMVEADGWRLISQRGSHRQFTHPVKKGRVTIAGKLSDDLAPGTLASVERQAGLK